MTHQDSRKRKILTATTAISMAATAAIPTAVQADSQKSFVDLKEGDPYYSSIQQLVERGVINGFPDGTIRVKTEVSRSQAASMMASVLDLDTTNVINPNFSDVAEDAWYYEPVAALAEVGILNGDANTNTYRPDDTLTRGEMAMIISDTFNLEKNAEAAAQFEDIDSDNWYAGSIGALYENGITVGKTATSFAPKDIVTRGEVAAFLNRSLNLDTEITAKEELSDDIQSIVNSIGSSVATIDGNTVSITADEVINGIGILVEIAGMEEIRGYITGDGETVNFAGRSTEEKIDLIVDDGLAQLGVSDIDDINLDALRGESYTIGLIAEYDGVGLTEEYTFEIK